MSAKSPNKWKWLYMNQNSCSCDASEYRACVRLCRSLYIIDLFLATGRHYEVSSSKKTDHLMSFVENCWILGRTLGVWYVTPMSSLGIPSRFLNFSCNTYILFYAFILSLIFLNSYLVLISHEHTSVWSDLFFFFC